MYEKFLNIKSYSIGKIDFSQPEILFEKHASKPGSALLTGTGDKTNSEFSFVAIDPNLIVSYRNNLLHVNTETGKILNVWDWLKGFLNNTTFHKLPFPANKIGLVGYFSYEMCREIERLPKTTIDSYQVPLFRFLAYRCYYVFDNYSKQAWRIDIEYGKEHSFNADVSDSHDYSVSHIKNELSREKYINRVEKIQDYIRQGDVYEVNFTQQINGRFTGNAFALFKRMYAANPAPYSCFLNLPDLKILSISPEMFLRAKGKTIETRPIKGTIKRGSNPVQDQEKINRLLASAKDQAELFMIIDLLRNDLGKVSEIGSVFVRNPKKLEKFENVYHLVGCVESQLRGDIDYIDLIKAAFPGGSITGCPKIRTMEIIDELETYSRNLYTGSILIMNQIYLNSSIVIRTAIVKDDEIFLNSGGAVTIDSKPEEEYLEMKTKINNILALLEGHK